MNTYKKFCPNVFVAKCDAEHKKGEVIKVLTKYGKENECIVFNKISEGNGFYYYSIVRADGYNAQERAKAKAQRLISAADKQGEKSDKYFAAATKNDDFLALGEPIKVGHHSERRHRKLFEEKDRNFSKMHDAMEQEKEYRRRAEYWAKRENEINLSMPESIDYFAHKLEEATEYHAGLKSGKYPKTHSYTVPYAKKAVNDLQKKYDIAKLLWGDE
jgi:hypothetical protein